jgi:hypothetical protein
LGEFFQDAVKPFRQIWKCYSARDYTNAGKNKIIAAQIFFALLKIPMLENFWRFENFYAA